jgi:hypothetical protein
MKASKIFLSFLLSFVSFGSTATQDFYLHSTAPGSHHYWMFGRDVGSENFWLNGREPGSQFFWKFGTELGSESFWKYGRDPGSLYFWEFGNGPGSKFHWFNGTGPGSLFFWKSGLGPSIDPIFVALCNGGVIDIAPCSSLILPKLSSGLKKLLEVSKDFGSIKSDQPPLNINSSEVLKEIPFFSTRPKNSSSEQ